MSEGKREQIIKLKILDENGVKYESIDNFNVSLFRNVYYEAFVNTWKIIKHNKDYKNTDSMWKRDRMYNIIPFWGPRGMGKTSVMRSFLGELDHFSLRRYTEYYDNNEEQRGKKFSDGKEGSLPRPEDLNRCNFVFLECIDASLLAEGEDIFEVILAKMLDGLLPILREYRDNKEWSVKYNEGYFRYTKNELIARFDELHKYLVNMRDIKGRHEAGTGAMEILKDLSGSLDLRAKFRELVPLYLEVMLKGEKADAEHKMLVISIDDIDMKLSGYEMLEQLHRYFMIPDVLIYITVAESELFAACYQHFITNIREGATTQEKQKRLAKAYIDKVLPFSKRIYMPVLSGYGQKIEVVSVKGGIQADTNIKKVILYKIAESTGIYFDGCGVKKHFYEPENIRELVNLYSVLNKIDCLADEGDIPRFVNNMSCIMNDIIYRLAARNLDGILRDRFATIAEMNQERQGIAFLQTIIENLSNEQFKENYNRYGYSYGELLRSLYMLGREKGDYKSFVHCVLALETSQMTDLYQRFLRLKHDDSEESFSFLRKLKHIMNGSMCGSWGNKLVPKMTNTNLDDTDIFLGFHSSTASWGYIRGEYGRVGEALRSFVYTAREKSGVDSEKEKFLQCKEFLEDTEILLIQSLELICLFLTNHKASDGTGWFKIEKLNPEVEMKITGNSVMGNEQENKDDEDLAEDTQEDNSFRTNSDNNIILANIKNCNATFDILGFVINCMLIQEFFDNVEKELMQACKEYCGELSDVEKEELTSIIQEKSLKTEFIEWGDKYNYMALPVYSTDVIYNVLKRAVRKCSSGDEYTISEQDIIRSLRKAYENIGEELKKEDVYYENLSEENQRLSLCEAFLECPVVKIIMHKTYGNQFEEMFCDFIKLIKLHENASDTEEIFGEI